MCTCVGTLTVQSVPSITVNYKGQSGNGSWTLRPVYLYRTDATLLLMIWVQEREEKSFQRPRAADDAAEAEEAAVWFTCHWD